MTGPGLNRLSAIGLIALSVFALACVAIGFTQPPQPDEGTLAHLFQLSVLGLLPFLVLFLATASWEEPRRSARPLVIAAAALALAFGGLYVLEHFR